MTTAPDYPLGRVRVLEVSAVPLLSLATLRKQCEIIATDVDSDGTESHPDDELLAIYLAAAVEHAEDFTGLCLVPRTLEVALDQFPLKAGGIDLPRPPLVEVLSFVSNDGSDGAVDPDTYLLDLFGDVASLRPLSAWPGLEADAGPNAVKVRYRAGYQAEEDADSDTLPLPGAIKAAILLTVGHLYRNREATVEKAMSELPLGVESLLRPKRVRTGMA